MNFPLSGADAPTGSPPDPAQDPSLARFHAKVRWLMMISGVATVLGIAVVIGVIGYRVFKSEGSAPDITALLPKGAKIIGTTIAADRIAVVVDTGGTVEVRTYDLHTLRPAGRLKFAAEP